MMIVTAWLVHCVIISAVLAAGALAWELSARWSGRPARWVWLGALVGSVSLPWLLRLIPERSWPEVVPAVVSSAMSPVFVVQPALDVTAAAGVDAAAGTWSAVDYALLVWVLLSLLVVCYVVRVMWAVARARQRWLQAELEGGRVYVTRNMGPAALGVREGMIVLPRWALQLDSGNRSLLLLHEREHVRAGDPRLVLTGLVLLAAMPWNPVVWFHMLRLRNAIELDCDARVLGYGVDPRSYGSLLLEVGSRRSRSPLVMATFAEPRVFLEERIRRIARWPLERRRGRAAGFALAALALFATALSARDPLRPTLLLGGGPSGEQPSMDLPVVGDVDVTYESLPLPLQSFETAIDTPPAGPEPAESRPSFTPMTRRPELINPGHVQEALNASYPAQLRAAGIGGRAVVWTFVGRDGAVERAQLSSSSGYPALDEAALQVAVAMEFTPAFNRDERVAVWVEIPIIFRPTGGAAGAAAGDRRSARDEHVFVITAEDPPARGRPAAVAAAAAQPAPQRPELLNPGEVFQALLSNYPAALRDAGVGGVSVLWLFIDTDGRVLRTQLGTSSGQRALDELALSVVSTMRFRPLVTDGAAVQTWVEMPIVFGAEQRPPQPTRRDGLVSVPALMVIPQQPGGRGAAPAPRTGEPPIPPELAELARAPTFTPMTVRPELQNAAEVQRVLVRNYPPLLRDAGIGGTPVVWFFVDDTGRVLRARVSASSGYPALDEAAIHTAYQMRFSPALNRDARVPVWVEIPISFTAR